MRHLYVAVNYAERRLSLYIYLYLIYPLLRGLIRAAEGGPAVIDFLLY
jgi:hypothetical protein